MSNSEKSSFELKMAPMLESLPGIPGHRGRDRSPKQDCLFSMIISEGSLNRFSNGGSYSMEKIRAQGAPRMVKRRTPAEATLPLAPAEGFSL